MVLKKKRKLLRGTERLENKGFMNDLFFVYSKNDQNFKVLRDKVEDESFVEELCRLFQLIFSSSGNF